MNLQHPFFQALAPEGRLKFYAACTLRTIKRGDMLVAYGAESRHNYFIEEGLLCVDMPGNEGMAPTGFLSTSDMAGESLSGDFWVSQADYIAVLPTSVVCCPLEACRWLIRTDPTAGLKLLEKCLMRITLMRKELRRTNHESAEVTVGRTLYQLSKDEAGRRMLDRRITQGTVAAYVGLSREQVNKTMRQLEAQGKLTRHPDGYEVTQAFAQTTISPL